jgi:hypothetical protein
LSYLGAKPRVRRRILSRSLAGKSAKSGMLEKYNRLKKITREIVTFQYSIAWIYVSILLLVR